jgi:lipopolysaccharide/colanic/teichoic acid biosynthesis glycosyltransferase
MSDRFLASGNAHRGETTPTTQQSADVTNRKFRRDWYKRPFDLGILLVAYVLLFPIWLFLWIALPLAIWISDRGPIFYAQTRSGKDGKPFKIVKFRTMIMNAERATGPVWATDDDPRVTGFGRFLRRFRLDELPQVINILKGEMSLVGPRPERPELVDEFSKDVPAFATRNLVRPGFAGLAQVRGRYSTTPRNKLRYDHLYIQTLTPLLDIKLMFLAVFVVLRGSPSSSKKN